MGNLSPATRRSSPITGVILAGGLGRRMGRVDKGLRDLRGKPLVQWVIERFAPQVDELLINANQNLETYARFGYRVIPDAIDGFAGPLAGLQRGMAEARHDLIATVPCDSPFLPSDLVARLSSEREQHGADIAVAKTGDQPHPVFCLCRKSLLHGLTAFLSGGGRKIDAWYATLSVVEVLFDDEAAAFSNINTREELQSFETDAERG
ncbi:MAG: molybdenum cofactor guanylyltransferase [Betaproteobacteria bacterium]|nr:molybdenum cofactor guanylyltransferase [Betaproteobacteria bacterium]